MDQNGRMYLNERQAKKLLPLVEKYRAKERKKMVDGFIKNLPPCKEARPQFTNLPNTNPLGRRFSRVGESLIPDVNGDYEERFIPVN